VTCLANGRHSKPVLPAQVGHDCAAHRPDTDRARQTRLFSHPYRRYRRRTSRATRPRISRSSGRPGFDHLLIQMPSNAFNFRITHRLRA
jgi:hypothetical protein